MVRFHVPTVNQSSANNYTFILSELSLGPFGQADPDFSVGPFNQPSADIFFLANDVSSSINLNSVEVEFVEDYPGADAPPYTWPVNPVITMNSDPNLVSFRLNPSATVSNWYGSVRYRYQVTKIQVHYQLHILHVFSGVRVRLFP